MHNVWKRIVYSNFKSGDIYYLAISVKLKENVPVIKDANELEKDVYVIKKDGITYIFTWHPSYQPKDYEEKVLSEVIAAIESKK